MDFSAFQIRKAGQAEVQAICDLVNLSYRGARGWTTEAAIIHGHRAEVQDIEIACAKSGANFFVMFQQNELIACIYVVVEGGQAFIGFFSVHPDWQGKGVGKYLLAYAENHARAYPDVHGFLMFVIAQRPELIAFYRRRGYQLTGRIDAFPAYLGKPKVSGLTIAYLEKQC